MNRVIEFAKRAARTNASVLITGESGSGKEVVARAIHHFSARVDKPWVDVSCAALPDNLVESELFGYDKGAFSGADANKPGLFELADTGTIFLDEIGELDPRMQVKLLRVLDGVPYYRLGGRKKISVNVRVVAATNVDVEEAVDRNDFRLDLYHRLGQIRIEVPPLRERPEDVAALAHFFLQRDRPDCQISSGAVRRLQDYSWPGNTRELRNVVSRMAVLCEGNLIGEQDVTVGAPSTAGTPDAAGIPMELPICQLQVMEEKMIRQALLQTAGNQSRAAELLGISRRTLTRKLKATPSLRDLDTEDSHADAQRVAF